MIYTNGEFKEDDRDELERALEENVISISQHQLANTAAFEMIKWVVTDFNGFITFCFDRLREMVD